MSNNEFEDITGSGNKTLATARMAVGETFQGTLVEVEASAKYPEKKNLVMEDGEGHRTVLFTSGSLNYAVQDGKFEVGRTYRITRIENKLTKKGQSRTQFQIQRLRDDGSAAVPAENNAAVPTARQFLIE